MERAKLKQEHLECIIPAPFFSYLILLLVTNQFSFASAQNARVGVVLDLASMAGKRSRTSISMALEEFYSVNWNFSTRIEFEFRDSMSDVISASSAAVDLLKNSQVEAIMGPLTSTQTEFVAYICNRSQVPLLSFSASSPAISPLHLPFFVRANINDSSQSKPIAAFIQNFGWHGAIPIYENSDYGSGIIPSLVDALELVETKIPYRLVIPTEATDDQIDVKLYHLMTLQTRVFVVHMLPELASRFFRRVQALGMMSEGYVWLVTDSIGDVLETLDPDVINAMEGVIGFRPYFPQSVEVKSFTTRFRKRFQQENPTTTRVVDPTIYQLWAYDAVWAMAKAVETTKVTNPNFVIPSSNSTTTDLSILGVSQTGPKLLSALLTTTFGGLAGNFRLVDGQLQLLAFEIVNVVGKSIRNIGFWTPDKGIVREIDSNKDNNNSNNLRSIIWPGDTNVASRGWVVPTNGKVLRIAIPAKPGFSVFVNVSGPINDNMPTSGVTGYCIDVFKAAISKLPYAIPYEFYPLNLDSYNDLVYQVYLKNYDAVVGDVTIRANRTNYVDFTMPYTESGVSMIVPLHSESSKSMWIFLQPLTMRLWLGSLGFFFLTGIVVWVIEHPTNSKFQGTISEQIGVVCYYAFSTLVFAHKEKLKSNFSRFMVIIWVFVVLILTSSYTASLTSMLTVQKLQPSVTDISQLLKQGAYVGYQDGSFLKDLLIKLGFEDGRLRNLSSADNYADALAKGSANGGVAAVFDETPYVKVFLSQYCDNKYGMVPTPYKTDGFGFVFPRGSPLLQDMSRAMLSVTEGDEMTRIERKWLGDPNNTCSASSTSINSFSLGFNNFVGLFIITGSVSGLMLICYIGRFCYKKRRELTAEMKNNNTPWIKARNLFEIYEGYGREQQEGQQVEPQGALPAGQPLPAGQVQPLGPPQPAAQLQPGQPGEQLQSAGQREGQPAAREPQSAGQQGEQTEGLQPVGQPGEQPEGQQAGHLEIQAVG